LSDELINIFNSLVANATPLVIAGIGETITERVGVVNLSLDGSIILAAMVAFVVGLATGSVIAGVLAAMLVGALVALIIAVADIELKQDQVAIGFVLTLLCADLAQFLGQEYTRTPGVQFPFVRVPILHDIPAVGEILFNHQAPAYLSYILIFATWYILFYTRAGLSLRAVGERPTAAFARGTNVNRTRYLYVLIGGALVGLAGAA